MTNNKTLCIAEWQSFGVEDIQEVIADKSKDKAQKIFSELQNFANQKGNFDDRRGNHIFLIPYRNNRLKARNYVGLIQTKSGFCLEILPKTFRAEKFNEGIKCSDNKECSPICKAKQILLTMLKTLKNSPFKQSHLSALKTQNMPLLEVFAMMFLDELERLIKKGIKSDYVAVEQNRPFLKGKLLFNENLKINFAHKERFFTASDEFLSDIAPNRLIVSTLLFLSGQNFSLKTDAKIKQSRFVFEAIKPSQNIDKDFAKCVNSRHFKAYWLILLWCKLFLKREHFTSYQGSSKAFALLFDMNVLFESFVARHLKKAKGYEYEIKTQEKGKFLCEVSKGEVGNGESKNLFLMKPDIVCRKQDNKDNKKSEVLFIADTKWKIIDSVDSILQADLYQLFAYLAKYECEKGFLIYPKIEGNEKAEELANKKIEYKAKSNLSSSTKDEQSNKTELNLYSSTKFEPKHKLKIYFFDVSNVKKAKNSAKELLE